FLPVLWADALNMPGVDPREMAELAVLIRKQKGGKAGYRQAIKQVEQGFASIHVQMGEFVRSMAEKGWVELSKGPNRNNSSCYCIPFPKSENPRVFMRSEDDVNGLAHEIGHAFHYCYAMKGIHPVEKNIPIVLSEFCSTFAEIAVKEHLYENASAQAEKLRISLLDMMNIKMDLMLEPAKFELEQSIYSSRQKNTLTPQILNRLERKVFDRWYENTLAQKHEFFWLSNKAFYRSGNCFYNCVYTFGYLFSLGVYSRMKKSGRRFYPDFIALLRDCGRMRVFELAQKHLKVDLARPEFWKESLKLVKLKIERFTKNLKKANYLTQKTDRLGWKG
ncbi:M3 family metallopeptidase, partial [Candidatus Riflebacteria bacterium]